MIGVSNTALENIIDRVHYLRGRLMSDPERRSQSLEEMRRLTAALLQRDRIEARNASIAHINAARDTLIQGLADERAKRISA